MNMHVNRVQTLAASAAAAARCRKAASWRRSALQHGLHPGENRAPRDVSTSTLKTRQTDHAARHVDASDTLDRLFTLVGRSGCGLFLTDQDGVGMTLRCTAADQIQFHDWGIREGAIWSEEAQGTNGVGTCLAENRPVVVHREDHFFVRNTGISCIAAPVYGADGALVGALNVTSAREDQTRAMNTMMTALVAQSAQEIESIAFHAAFRNTRIVVAAGRPRDLSLLALDADDLVIGATRAARRQFGLGIGTRLAPRLAQELLKVGTAGVGFARAERTAVIQALTQTGSNVSQAARLLGIGRATMYRRMERLNVSKAVAIP